MRRRMSNVAATPAVIVALLKKGWHASAGLLNDKRALYAVLAVLAAVLAVLTAALWQSTAPYRALRSYENADYNRSAELFGAVEGAAARYNAANAWYRSGAYERALERFGEPQTDDPLFAARVWYNRGNTLVRLKEFEKAREAYARSLALHYDENALENMMHILAAEEQDHMLTGRQEGKKRAQDQEAENSEEGSRKPKEGGGSNQQSSAERTRGAGSQGKKVEREEQLQFSDKGNSRLSSKQYELINQRSIHETKPW